MSQLPSQIDAPNPEYVILANQIYDVLTTAPIPAIGIPSSVMTKYKSLLDPVNESWDIVKNKATSTSVQLTIFNNNREALSVLLRPFVQQWLYANPLATNDIIQSTGLRLHSTNRVSHAGQPKDTPVASISPISGHGFKAIIRNEVGKLAKPDGVSIIRARYFIGVGAPANPWEFPMFKDYTKNPINLMIPADNAGQIITIAFCYVSTTGAVEGNYCVVIVTKVP